MVCAFAVRLAVIVIARCKAERAVNELAVEPASRRAVSEVGGRDCFR
jgi:hypothetical protein